MSRQNLWKRVRLVSCAAMLSLVGSTAAATPAHSENGAATAESQSPITNSFSGYIIAVG